MKPQLESLGVYKAGLSEEALKRKFNVEGEFSRLASNENPMGPSPEVYKAIRSQDALNYYPDPEAIQLKASLSEFYQVDSEQILVGAGLDEIIMMISRARLNPKGHILTSEGTFIQYTTHALIEDNEVVSIPLKEGKFDLESFKDKMNDETSIIWICNPNNPTGTYVTETELTGFLESVHEDVMVVLDEAYFEFVLREDYPDGVALLKRFPNLIVLRTFSKAYGLAGLRVGYAITSKAYIDVFNKVKLPFNVTALSLVGAIAALKDQQYLKDYVAHNDKERNKFFEADYKEHLIDSVTNFIFVKTNQPEALFEALIKGGVIARPMPNGVRISIGTRDDNEKVHKVINSFFS